MKGASEVGEITARSDAALAAGCDMILICNDPESAKTVLENQRWIAPRHLMKEWPAFSRGKFPSWDGLKLSRNYLACVKQIEAFNAEIAEKPIKRQHFKKEKRKRKSKISFLFSYLLREKAIAFSGGRMLLPSGLKCLAHLSTNLSLEMSRAGEAA